MHLLERENQLKALDGALSDAARGHGRVVLVSGEAGIGKTSLVREFLQQIDTEGPRTPRILRGACENLSVAEPLAPLYDLARDAGWQAPSSLSGGDGRLALFSDALGEFSTWPSGTVLVIEDLHWADEATLDFVRFLSRRIPNYPVLLLATSRSEASSAQSQLRRALGEMPSDALIRIPLPPLSENAVGVLARAVGRDAQPVWEVTGGNAFFVTELLQSDGSVPPPSVNDAVLARADRLSERARNVLDVASLFPRRAEIELVRALLGDDAEEGMEDCVDSGLLNIDGANIVFRHELARQAIEGALRASRRRLLNADIYERLTAVDAPAARRLHHARAAGLNGVVQTLAPVAAAAAETAGARREAAEYYRAAIDAGDGAASTELLEDAATANYLVGRYDIAVKYQNEVMDRLAKGDDTLRLGDAWRRLSRYRWSGGDIVTSWGEAEKAIEILTGHDSPELALAYANLSQLRMLAYSDLDAEVPARKAIDIAEKFGRHDIIAQAKQNIAGYILYTDIESAKRLMQDAIDTALAHGHAEPAARGMVNMAYMYWWHFQYEEGSAVSKKHETYALEQELDAYHEYHGGTRALMELELGNLEEAERLIRKTTAPPEQHYQGWQQFPGTVAHARWLYRTQQPDDPVVSEYLERYLKTAKESQRLAPIAEFNAERAWVEGADPEPAIAGILSVIDLAPRSETVAYMRVWLHRLGAGHLDTEVNDYVPEPHRTELLGDPGRAAALWAARKAPYNQAFALAFSGQAGSREKAAQIFRGLGAHAHANAALRKPDQTTTEDQHGPDTLSRRQMDVLRCLAEGKTNAQVGEALFISPKTVDHHVSAILGKLGASNRGEAVAIARDAGLLN